MEILNSTIDDMDEIFRLYKAATDFQKTKHVVQWLEFNKALIKLKSLNKHCFCFSENQ